MRTEGRAETTRRNILDAALTEFQEHGLAGARVDEAAARANANKRMISVYFESKENLWLTVLEQVYGARRSGRWTSSPAAARGDGEAGRLQHALRRRPSRVRHPARAGEPAPRRTPQAQPQGQTALPAATRHHARPARARRSGWRLRAGVDPMQLYITLVGVSHFYITNLHTLSTIFGTGLAKKKALAAREAHCVDVILAYLRPDTHHRRSRHPSRVTIQILIKSPQHSRWRRREDTAMAERRIGLIMHGVTGRMGMNQHLIRSIAAIRRDGGVPLRNGDRLMSGPILIGRDRERLEALARQHGVERVGTDLDVALANPEDSIFFDAATTQMRASLLRHAIAAGKAVYCEDRPPTTWRMRSTSRGLRRGPASRTAWCRTSSSYRASSS